MADRRPLLPLLALGLIAALAAACSSSSTSTTSTTSSAPGLGGTPNTVTPAASLTGAGASSAAPFLTRSFYDYSQLNPKVQVSYDPAGSSVGVADLQANSVDFGQSEIPMSASDEAKATGGAILQVPIDLGGVAISYNVPGAPKDLHLSGAQLAGIYLGTITDWHQISSTIPSGTSIIAVHRADSSGPGYDVDQYLIDTSPTWVSATGSSTASKTWPKANLGVGEQLNSGVAKYIEQTPGAIGYVEYAYALQNKFTNAALLNKAGSYVSPSISSIAAAGAQATALSATTFNIVNGVGAATYPIANFSWTMLYQKQSSSDKGTALGKLFDWIATTGQAVAPSLGYAPLPANARALTHQTLLTLQSSTGSPLFTK
jgi:phosphate transport system substrate-binding protein